MFHMKVVIIYDELKSHSEHSKEEPNIGLHKIV